MNWKRISLIYLTLVLTAVSNTALIAPASFASHARRRIAQKSKSEDNAVQSAENYGRSLAEADQLLLDGHYQKAESAYRALVDGDQTGDALAGLAVALAKQSIPDKILEAERVLKQARDKFEDNPNVLAAGGYVSYVHAKTVASPARRDLYLEAADSLCSKAVRENPDIVIAQQTIGLARLAQDQAEDAIDPLRKATSLDESASNLTLLAQALLRTDPKDDEANSLLDSALEKTPDYYPAVIQKAYILAQKGKQEDAYMKLQSVPDTYRSADWYMIIGDVYHKQGDGPAALSSWQQAIERDPHNPDSYRRLAEYYTLRGDGELAIAEMHNALEILPNDQALRNQLAELALRQDKLEVAEAEYRTILAANPDDAQGLLGLSRVYFRKARRDGQYPPDWQQLMEQLQNVVTEKSVRAQVIKSGAKSLKENIELSEAEKSLSQNHFREARRHFATVINSHKDDAYGLLTLGEQAFNDGDLTAAQQAYDYAKEIPEVTPRAEQGISKIVTQRNEAARQTKLGDATRRMPDVAIDHYKQALIADPQFPSAYYGLYSMFARPRGGDPQLAIANGLCFLEAADDSDKLRPEVEDNVSKLQKRISRSKGK
jgi:tetratricopeptide (TPR) repeat protein